MNPDVKAKWVAALRSGDYKQGRNALHRLSTDTYCCLGVLCELAVAEGITKKRSVNGIHSGYAEDFDYNSVALPNIVAGWAGLADGDGTLPSGAVLIHLNDTRMLSFSEIADRIEEEL